VPLFSREKAIHRIWAFDRWLLGKFTVLEHYSTSRVMKLQKIS
jgi:hypothetical protein